MYKNITTQLENGLFLITINRPEKLNALNREVITELGEALLEIDTNPAIKAAIITGAGPKAFVAGADISEFTSLDAAGGSALAEKGQHLVFNRIENCTKPIIAAVNGFALGGGCELAMACHFRLASSNAKFGQPEVNLGLIPGYGGTQRLTQLVGKGKAMELMMTGAMIDAQEALRLGLVNYVSEPEALLEKSRELLSVIISKAPLAVAKIIELVNVAAIGSPDGLKKEIDAFGELFGTEDMKEGATAFLEKRKASFTGK
jgi:enoyl-CoA hydratase